MNDALLAAEAPTGEAYRQAQVGPDDGRLTRDALAAAPLAASEIWRKNPVVFYVHIPFCNNICYSCIYNKFNTHGPLVAEYLTALKAEIASYAARPHIRDSEFISGYIGGGTPTALTTEQLDDLLTFLKAHYDLRSDDPRFTVTVETTPNEMDDEKASMLRGHGIDRVSIGVQSFDDAELRAIGRTHTGEKARRVVGMVRRAGFEHICVDLMYGLPGQTIDEWMASVDAALRLRVDSVSMYPYLVLPDSRLSFNIQRGATPPTPDQPVLDEMFTAGVEKILGNGYFAVTTNDFGKTEGGMEKWKDFGVQVYDVGPEGYHGFIVSTFPLTTQIAHSWYEGGDVLGTGAGAYGTMKRHLYINDPDVHSYIARVKRGELPIVAGNYISPEEKMARFMVMGLKFLKLLRSEFLGRFGVDMLQVYDREIRQLEAWGLIEVRDDALQVTYPKGWSYIDNISKTFYTRANYRMPQPVLTNTNILKYVRKRLPVA